MAEIAGEVIEQLPGLSKPLRRLNSGFVVQEVDWRDDPDRDEAWADKESAKYGGRQSPYWRQNYERELIRGGEPVWPMLRHNIHVREIPFKEIVGDNWALYRSIDHGMRHPFCCAWLAVHRGIGDYYFYRQYYMRDMTIAVNSKHVRDVTEASERIVLNVADPSIWQRDPRTLETYAEDYGQEGLYLTQGDNSRAGYDALTAGFIASIARHALGRRSPELVQEVLHTTHLSMGDVEELAARPAIWFHPSCAGHDRSLYQECVNLRWQQTHGDPEHKAAPEKPEDKNDEGPDVVRYAVQTPCVRWLPMPKAGLSQVDRHLLAILNGEHEPSPARSRLY